MSIEERDYDIAKPVGVRKVEEGCGKVYCEVQYFGEWKNVQSVIFKRAVWYGPILVPRPHPALMREIDAISKR